MNVLTVNLTYRELIGWAAVYSTVVAGRVSFQRYCRNGGAVIHGFDYDENSINLARIRLNKYPGSKLSVGTIDDVLASNEKYDVILSLGVAHHNADPVFELDKLDACAAANSLLILGVGDKVCSLQHLLLKYLVRVAGNSEGIKNSVLLLAPDYVDRCIQFGGRTIDQVIFDQFVNPIHNYTNFKSVFEWARASGYSLLNYIPRLSGSFSDSLMNDSVFENRVNFMEFSNILCSMKTTSDYSDLKHSMPDADVVWSMLNGIGTLLAGDSDLISHDASVLSDLRRQSSVIREFIRSKERDTAISLRRKSMHLMRYFDGNRDGNRGDHRRLRN